jgi:hypothetical protein
MIIEISNLIKKIPRKSPSSHSSNPPEQYKNDTETSNEFQVKN